MNNTSETASSSKLRMWENMHIVFWLVKDMCWVSDFHLIGMIMIFPTISVAIWMVFKSLGNKVELVHNIAVLCWISANSVWMTGEFYLADTTRPWAQLLFALGIVALALHYVPHVWRYMRSKQEL